MDDRDVSQHAIEVIAGPEAAASARAAVAHLGISQLQERLDDVRLATSELVTNAVRHGRLRRDIDVIRVTVGTGEESVRVTVEQPTVADVKIAPPRIGEEAGGFGLRLVDQFADHWGYEPGPPGRVWAEFGRPH